jgi:hypothetical protein
MGQGHPLGAYFDRVRVGVGRLGEFRLTTALLVLVLDPLAVLLTLAATGAISERFRVFGDRQIA